MVFNKIEMHKTYLENRKQKLKEVAPSDVEYKKVLGHLKLLEIGEITGKPIGEKRQQKIIDMFILFFKNYKENTEKLTLKKLRKIKEDLLNDKILKENGKPYSDDTKEDLTETLTRYLECVYPIKIPSWSTARNFRKWFVIRAKKKTPEVLTEEQVKELIEASRTIEGKFLIAVLFDSGCRIEEFLNLRYEDIEAPTENHPYYRFDFKEEYSKTRGRKISLFWKESNNIIAKYLATCEKKDSKERIFPKEYDAVRMFLLRLGKKVLNKRVHPHIFRKSSATFYSSKLNRQQLSVRFGWTFSSQMPDVYIARSGVDEDKIKDVFVKTDYEDVKREMERLQTDFEKMKRLLLASVIGKKQITDDEKQKIQEVIEGILTK